MKRIVVSLLICVMVALGGPSIAAAADGSPVLSRIVKNGELRVGMSGNQPPFTVKSKAGKLIGFEVDVANMLAGAMNVELKLVEIEFSKLLPALQSGEVDVVMSGMTMTPERNLQVAFVGPYIVSGKSILTTSKTLAAIEAAQEINQENLKLTALRGSTSQKFVEKAMPKAQLITVPDYDKAVQAVLEGRADAMGPTSRSVPSASCATRTPASPRSARLVHQGS